MIYPIVVRRVTPRLAMSVCCLLGATWVPGTLTGQMSETDSIAQQQRNLGNNSELSLTDPPSVLWEFNAGGRAIGDPVLVGNLVVFTVGSERITALNRVTGERVWETADRFDQITGLVPADSDGQSLLVVTSYQGVTVIDSRIGDEVWSSEIGSGFAAASVSDRAIFAAGYDGVAVRLNLADGELQWEQEYLSDAPDDPPGFDGSRARFSELPARPRASSNDGKTVYFAVFDQCRVVGIDMDSGDRAHTLQTEGWIYNQPVVADDLVFIGSQDKHLYAMDKDMGHIVWKFPTQSRVEAPSAVTDTHVYFGSCDANFYCVDRETGEMKWHFETARLERFGGPIYEQPIVCRENVLLATMNGEVYAFDQNTGDVQWVVRPDEESQIVGFESDEERLYVTTRKGFDDRGEPKLIVLGASDN